MVTSKKEAQPAMTATKRLLAGLRDGKMADVELVGDDEIRVPALRCVLGCASPILHDLLYGDPSRASSSTIRITGCSHKTLRALVEYCCSDELNASIWDGSCPPAEIVKDIVALARVAQAYGIPNMEERVLEGVGPLMDAIPPLACVVFNYADSRRTREIYDSALGMIREKPYLCLQHEGKDVGGMMCLSPEKLTDIMRDDSIEVDELFLFKQLLCWRLFNQKRFANTNEICKKLVGFIDIAAIDPNDIKSTIVDSGLVDDKTITNALMDQAISASREGFAFATIRGQVEAGTLFVMVHQASVPECNGVYWHVPQEGTLLCYKKRIDEIRTMFIVKDSASTWKIRDREKIYYEWKAASESQQHEFPVNDWVATPAARGTPLVRLLRSRGKIARAPVAPPTRPAVTRIPVQQQQSPPYTYNRDESRSVREEDAGDNASSCSSGRHPRIFQSRSTGDYDGIEAESSASSTSLSIASSPAASSMLRPPPPLTQQRPTRKSVRHVRAHHHHQHHQTSSYRFKGETPVAVRINPRTPSPRISLSTNMTSINEAATWAV